MDNHDIIIIGAGISGLGASYGLRKLGENAIILEKDDTYGGLAGNFTIAEGFRFDRFVHFSFSGNDEVNKIFNESTAGDIIRHVPNPYNIYNRIWIKHPAQNNLYPLSSEEKSLIIEDFKGRNELPDLNEIKNYEQWLRLQFGNTFAERFPMQYTRKYWMSEAKDLETKWVGNRLYRPTLEEVIAGAESDDTPVTYYAKVMGYPTTGGFKQFLRVLADNVEIKYNQTVEKIDSINKIVTTETGKQYHYNRLISSMPLPLLIKALGDTVPSTIKEKCAKLRCTSGYQISIALKTENIPPYLWFYIYDKDILPARVYSPSLKSPDNVPEGCSSLQLEVYCKQDEYSREELIQKSVKPLIDMNLINQEDIIDIDVRFEPWANVIFDHNIRECRQQVIDYVRSIGIESIGRFGLWDYLWSDQALLSGLEVVKKCE